MKLLNKNSIADFEAVYKIMEESFPRDERRPFKTQKKLLTNEEYRIYTLHNYDGIIAFMALWEFEDFIYLEHFAVKNIFRNGGTGSSFLQEITSLYEKPICLEVEPPENDLAKRRIGFYERNGFILNDYDYMQPPLGEGQKSIPLKIMTYGKSVSYNDFVIIRDELYTKVYKSKVFCPGCNE